MWVAERDEQKMQGRDEEQRIASEHLIGWVDGGVEGGVLGAEKGSSLEASLRYSWSELGFHLARSPTQSTYIVLGAKTI